MQEFLSHLFIGDAWDELHYPLLHGPAGPIQFLHQNREIVAIKEGATPCSIQGVEKESQNRKIYDKRSTPGEAPDLMGPPVPAPSQLASLTSPWRSHGQCLVRSAVGRSKREQGRVCRAEGTPRQVHPIPNMQINHWPHIQHGKVKMGSLGDKLYRHGKHI